MTTWRDGLSSKQQKLLAACHPLNEGRKPPTRRIMDLVVALSRLLDAHEVAMHALRERRSGEVLEMDKDGRMDPTTEQNVKVLMESSRSEDEWNHNCDKVKAANDGGYPAFWYSTIISSGLLAQTRAKW